MPTGRVGVLELERRERVVVERRGRLLLGADVDMDDLCERQAVSRTRAEAGREST
jgi:hypothetical protein